MAKKKQLSPDDVLGRWSLVEQIDDGRGGNSEVWRAEGDDIHAAVKVLRRRDRLERFRDEIAFLSSYDGPGVLPLIDSHLEGDSVYWYSMPLATPLRRALAEDRSPQRIIEIFAVYARTLATLAELDVSHRDLKPDNLFLLDGLPVIGDFGLVVYPGKKSITEAGERMGPLFFHAPEMLETTDEADPKAADVWSLAKTLWVELAGTNYPLPGEHRPGNPFDLDEWVNHPRVVELNNLIVHCTRMDPKARPTMREVADELRAKIEPPAEATAGVQVPELQDRLVALTQPALDADRAAQDQRRMIEGARIEVSTHFGEVALDIEAMLGGRFRYSDIQAADASGILQARFSPGRTAAWVATLGGLYVSPDRRGRARVTYSVAVMLMDPSGRTQICGRFHVCEYYASQEETLVEWHEVYSASIGSTQFVQALATIRTNVKGREEESLKKIAEVLGRSENITPDWYLRRQ